MNRRAAMNRASPMIMAAAAGAMASATSGEKSMRRKLGTLREQVDAGEAERLRLPLLTDGEAKALKVGRYVVKRQRVGALAAARALAAAKVKPDAGHP
jgi:hypothetical protein